MRLPELEQRRGWLDVLCPRPIQQVGEGMDRGQVSSLRNYSQSGVAPMTNYPQKWECLSCGYPTVSREQYHPDPIGLKNLCLGCEVKFLRDRVKSMARQLESVGQHFKSGIADNGTHWQNWVDMGQGLRNDILQSQRVLKYAMRNPLPSSMTDEQWEQILGAWLR